MKEIARGNMKGIAKGLMSLVIVAARLVFIPAAARVGLLILSTAPNPRHPPGDVMGEAVGWAIVGALVGAVGAMIGEAVVMREERGVLATYQGLILGSVSAISLAAIFWSSNCGVWAITAMESAGVWNNSSCCPLNA